MKKLTPENINLFTSEEGVYIAPLVAGNVANGYLVSWEEIEEFTGRMLSLKKMKSEFDNGEFPF